MFLCAQVIWHRVERLIARFNCDRYHHLNERVDNIHFIHEFT